MSETTVKPKRCPGCGHVEPARVDQGARPTAPEGSVLVYGVGPNPITQEDAEKVGAKIRLERLIARSEKLLESYRAIGGAGAFGAAMIERDLGMARKALKSGTAVVQMADLLAQHE